MAGDNCLNQEEHYELHVCQLKCKEMNRELEKLYENPTHACTNCGARVNNPKNLCNPKEL
jgi:hydrogenase maturation factor HypF (carbamoyltransferase family)